MLMSAAILAITIYPSWFAHFQFANEPMGSDMVREDGHAAMCTRHVFACLEPLAD